MINEYYAGEDVIAEHNGAPIFIDTGNTEIITVDPSTFIKELINENFRLL